MMDCISQYLAELGDYRRLGAEEEQVLTAAILRGDAAARRKMVEGNLRLVVHVAKRYATLGVPLEDLIQEGNLGLLSAARRFDPSRGSRFGTYAYRWILAAIGKALDDRWGMPVRAVSALRDAYRAEDRLTGDLGRRPHSIEIAGEIGISTAELGLLRGMGGAQTSLDSPTGEHDACLLDCLLDPDSLQPERETCRVLAREELSRILRDLPPRARIILALRYGLHGREGQSFQRIGDLLGLSGERVRQLDLTLREALRHRTDLNTLQEALIAD